MTLSLREPTKELKTNFRSIERLLSIIKADENSNSARMSVIPEIYHVFEYYCLCFSHHHYQNQIYHSAM